jgi:hypothetical protein
MMEKSIIKLIAKCITDKDILLGLGKTRVNIYNSNRESLVSYTTLHEGKLTWRDSHFKDSIDRDTKDFNPMTFVIEFEKSPSIRVYPYTVEVKNEKYTIDGFVKRTFLCWYLPIWKPTTFEIIKQTSELRYKIRCGEYIFDIPNEIADKWIADIPVNRAIAQKHADKEEIIRRLAEYHIHIKK